MAHDPKPAEHTDAPPPKSKKLLIIILALILVVVLAGGGVAALLMLKKGSEDHGDDEEVAAETSKTPKKDKKKDAHAHPPVFVNLEPFTVNLVPETGDQYLQVALSVEFEDATGEALMKSNTPKIRNTITLLLSGKKASELVSREGKMKLALELKDEINKVLEPPPPPKKGKPAKEEDIEGPAKEVLFTSFIIQ